MADTKIGEITHFFDKISVAIIKLEKPLKKGETIKIGEVEQTVDSMQVDRADIEEGAPGQEVGVKVSAKVREGDDVYKAE
jgi:putative protease